MFFCLVNNYLICYKIGNGSQEIADDIFDFKRYLRFFDSENKVFMREFCKTQGFHNFIEKSYRAINEKNDVSFFVDGVKLCCEKGSRALAILIDKMYNKLMSNNKNVS